MSILLTGSTGFVGARLVELLDGRDVFCAVRRQADLETENLVNLSSRKSIVVGNISGSTDWSSCFRLDNQIDTVIHCAARAQVMNDVQDPLFEVNVDGVENLARQAAAAGVMRFIFLSSIKVNGEVSKGSSSEGGAEPFTASDTPAPEDDYGISKHKAEAALKKVCAHTEMKYVVIRPPLVYGPGVKANFFSMLKWVSSGVPLPLGNITSNRRSLVFVDNLVDLIDACVDHPAAGNQTFLVSDDDDISTRELFIRVASALGKKSCLLDIPARWFGLVGKLLGKKNVEQRLCASLQLDITHTKNTLKWTPPLSMEEGLKQTADWYKAR